VKRPRLHRLDRVLLAAASRAMTRSIWSSFVVRPETLLRWHRELVRKKWTFRRRGHPGRPPIEPEVRDLISGATRLLRLMGVFGRDIAELSGRSQVSWNDRTIRPPSTRYLLYVLGADE